MLLSETNSISLPSQPFRGLPLYVQVSLCKFSFDSSLYCYLYFPSMTRVYPADTSLGNIASDITNEYCNPVSARLVINSCKKNYMVLHISINGRGDL